MTTTTSDTSFRYLHAVRVRGVASDEALATELADETSGAWAAGLEQLREAGHLTVRKGRRAGWTLTSAGREEHARLLEQERAGAAWAEEVSAAYRVFLALNQPALDLCSRSQAFPDGTLNDHSDPAYEAALLQDLRAIDTGVQPVCDRLSAARHRFSRYGPRFTAALARIADGEHRYFTSPLLDSYHTVWFELHEDLLLTLGIEREEGR